MMETKESQLEVCNKYGASFLEAPSYLKIGISYNVKDRKLFPVNGLRHMPTGDTTGWYIWAGEEFSEDVDFFVPLHVEHLKEWRPEILKFLGLPSGYRFLIGKDDYEDVWYDDTLLEIEE